MNKRMNKRKITIIIISFYLLVLTPLILAADPLKEAGIAFSRGDYATAVKLTSTMISKADDQRKIIALIRRSEAYRALGHLREARSDLNSAIIFAQQQQQILMQAIASLSLGQLLFQQQNYSQASKLLQTTQLLAQKLKQPLIEASAMNTLGNILSNQNQKSAAIKNYREALKLAEQGSDIAIKVASRRNLAKALGNSIEATEQFKLAKQEAITIPNLYERGKLLLAIAEDDKFSYPLLSKVLAISKQLNSLSLSSQAKGQLGALYEGQKRYNEALSLTEQAIIDAQQIASDDLLLKWQWQSGRLLKALGKRAAAISAYRQTIYYINAIRRDIPISYQGGHSSFRKTLSPIYTELADLLLQQATVVAKTSVAKTSAAKTSNNSDSLNKKKQIEKEQALLREARDTIEQIKLSEFQDYFQNPCIVSRTEKLETLAPQTAVLYPIILPDRLELLVSIGTKLTRYSTVVSKNLLQKTVKQLVKTLRPTRSGQLFPFDQKRATQLYDWLITPILPQLKEYKIDTLVFVPDGVFRSLPIAALSDGKSYLVEDFAIATVPGLTLFDPKSLPKKNMQALLTGLSQPGPVVLELSEAMWRSALNKNTTRSSRELRGIPITLDQLKTRGENHSFIERKADMANKVQQALALPGVKQEINQLSQRLQGKILMDKKFLLNEFSNEVANKPYRVVHIASHGFFGGAPEQNFIMTYDRKLNMNQLASILKPKQLAELPIELLTLSACQTAVGDDRSPLGLAGIALKSGARSILGTLWPIADNAAQQMLPFFYDKLIQPQTTKAKALQSAQLKLLKQKKFEHPFYWSSFILIGNWL